MPPRPKHLLLSAASAAALLAAAPSHAQSGEDLLTSACGACHAQEGGGFARIDAVRKTPEAWDMTLVRMMRNHGVHLSGADRAALVRHLSDTRGLAIEETAGLRYILEKTPTAADDAPSDQLAEMCSRCHSWARVGLQRRTAEDWEKLIHFHLGQFPTAEYQALARDRDWWGIARTEVLDYLAAAFPLGEAPAPMTADLSGEWRVAGHMPGRGDYDGMLTLETKEDAYAASAALHFGDETLSLTGAALVYGAGELRATLTDGGTEYRLVAAAGPEGIEGRWFQTEADVIGAPILGARTGGAMRVLSASPAYAKVGETATIVLAGVGLSADMPLPEGAQVIAASDAAITLKVAPTAEGPMGFGAATVMAYETLDSVMVTPAVTISRVGGNGGPIPKVPAQFEAVGMLNGPDGEAGTEDDVTVGVFDAAWEVTNFDEVAAAMEDAKFAGTIDADGFFTPGDAGPNPARPMNTNNAGNLKIIATVTDGETVLSGEAQLYATVQRFVDTPIR